MPTDADVITRGHKKKARTRQQLLDAALEVLAEQGEAFSIGDLVARAGVSHGTFYNYFADREELIAALVPTVVEAFAAEAAATVDDPDPAVRFATITARALAAAGGAPGLVRVALRIEAVQQELVTEGAFAHLLADLADGHRSGRFAQAPDLATLDLMIGTLLRAAGRIVDGEVDPDYRRSVIRHLLGALGIEATEAAALAKEAVEGR